MVIIFIIIFCAIYISLLLTLKIFKNAAINFKFKVQIFINEPLSLLLLECVHTCYVPQFITYIYIVFKLYVSQQTVCSVQFGLILSLSKYKFSH